MDANTEHPFDVLGIAATLDAQTIKRAYFARLAKVPPHADPLGFRKLRSAYESLQDSQALRRAWLSAPLDTTSALATWEGRFAARVQAARASADDGVDSRVRVDEFIDWVTRLRFEDTAL